VLLVDVVDLDVDVAIVDGAEEDLDVVLARTMRRSGE
jgi:hypothetical protein